MCFASKLMADIFPYRAGGLALFTLRWHSFAKFLLKVRASVLIG